MGQKNPEKSAPWLMNLRAARERCSNKNHACYLRYGGRGIKCFLTKEEIKTIWFRDKAFEMKRPSLDRIDNDGNYTLSNCRFLEFSENFRRSRAERSTCRRGHPFTEENTYTHPGGRFKSCRICRATVRMRWIKKNLAIHSGGGK